MNKKFQITVVAAALCGVGLLAPRTAEAKKPGVLEGKPVVATPLLLRKFRFQISPQVGMSLNQPFIHKGFVGAGVRVDFTEWIGVRGHFNYGIIDVDSRLQKALLDGGLPQGETGADPTAPDLPVRPNGELDNPAPLLHDFQAGLTKLQWTSSIDLAFTPFAGKLGLFSSIFTEYDIYIFGGVGLASYTRAFPDQLSTSEILGIENTDSPTDANGQPDPTYCTAPGAGAANAECVLHPVKADEGVRVGGSIGGGVHLFLTDWVSLNPEIQDVIVAQNDGGLNATIRDVPPVVNNAGGSDGDRTIRHNVTFNLGFTFYLPPKAKRGKLTKTRVRKGHDDDAAAAVSAEGATSVEGE
jgi:outer membrane beta-barrel protein